MNVFSSALLPTLLNLQGICIGARFHAKQYAARTESVFVLLDARVRNAPIHRYSQEADCYAGRRASCQCDGHRPGNHSEARNHQHTCSCDDRREPQGELLPPPASTRCGCELFSNLAHACA